MRPHIRHAPDASRHPRRARRAVLAGAVAALAVAAPAVAEPPPGFRSLAAFDDTTVLATVGGGCATPTRASSPSLGTAG